MILQGLLPGTLTGWESYTGTAVLDQPNTAAGKMVIPWPGATTPGWPEGQLSSCTHTKKPFYKNHCLPFRAFSLSDARLDS